jgi:hypothetical protein
MKYLIALILLASALSAQAASINNKHARVGVDPVARIPGCENELYRCKVAISGLKISARDVAQANLHLQTVYAVNGGGDHMVTIGTLTLTLKNGQTLAWSDFSGSGLEQDNQDNNEIRHRGYDEGYREGYSDGYNDGSH